MTAATQKLKQRKTIQAIQSRNLQVDQQTSRANTMAKTANTISTMIVKRNYRNNIDQRGFSRVLQANERQFHFLCNDARRLAESTFARRRMQRYRPVSKTNSETIAKCRRKIVSTPPLFNNQNRLNVVGCASVTDDFAFLHK